MSALSGAVKSGGSIFLSCGGLGRVPRSWIEIETPALFADGASPRFTEIEVEAPVAESLSAIPRDPSYPKLPIGTDDPSATLKMSFPFAVFHLFCCDTDTSKRW